MAAVTSYQDVTMSVSAIGGRTDAEGDDVTDFSAEEARFLAEIFTEGYVKPTDSFKVQPADTPDMTVVVGSGTAKADLYVVAGDTGGQGNYLVRLDAASQSVTVPAADASQARTDEVYLVVADDTYDAGGLSLPRIGYRKGDVGGGDPGPDTSWEAYVLLATISVPALETAIETANITDERVAATLVESLLAVDTDELVSKSTVDAKGDLLVGTGADAVGRLAVGSDEQLLVADSSAAAGVKWATVSAGPSGATDAYVDAFEGTTSTSYTDLASAGPAVTVTVGPAGIAIVAFNALLSLVSGSTTASASFAVSGANSLAASDDRRMFSASTSNVTGSVVTVLTGLSPGSTTFTAKYKSGSGSVQAKFSDRRIGVVTF